MLHLFKKPVLWCCMQNELEIKLKQIEQVIATNNHDGATTQILEEMADWIKGLLINYCE